MSAALGFAALSSQVACSGKSAMDKACDKMISLSEGKLDSAKCKENMNKAVTEMGDAKSKHFFECIAKIEKKEGMALCLAAAAPDELNSYINKSKSSEAMVNSRRIADAVRVFYHSPQVVGGATDLNPAVSNALPASVGPTPAKGACCQSEGKCVAESSQWDVPGWEALEFSVQGDHYYSYEYIRADDGKSFEVKTYGDLDCDGVYSTFTTKGSLVDGELSMAKMEEEQPLE